MCVQVQMSLTTLQSKNRVLLIVSSFRITFGGPLLNGNSFYCDVFIALFILILCMYFCCLSTSLYVTVFLLRKRYLNLNLRHGCFVWSLSPIVVSATPCNIKLQERTAFCRFRQLTARFVLPS